MGVCGSKDLTSKAHNQIEKKMELYSKKERATKKLLLLGSGSSGKSTLFKQLRQIHGTGFDQTELQESRHVIRQNCVSGILVILKKATEIAKQDPNLPTLDYADETIHAATDTVISFGNESFTEASEYDNLDELGQAIALLWQQDAIKATYRQRGNKFSFPDNMDYFFNKVTQVMDKDFDPKPEDVLKMRVRTTGMIEYQFELKENIFHVFDVGGQRNERKKWIHSFENVTAVIFVAALNGYNAVLFEDEKKNAMHESIELFADICNSKWFRTTEMILFLNKNDLFKERIRDGISLSLCFSEEAGWKGELWTGQDYSKKEDPSEDEAFFKTCYEQAVNFIQNQYLTKNDNNKVVFAHVTTATEYDNIKRVFWDVQNIIIRSNLKRAQLL